LGQVAKHKYRLDARVLDLGKSTMSSTGLREHAHTYLDELGQRTRYTASLAVLDGPDVLYVDRVRSRRRGEHKIGLEIRTGSPLPTYCTAPGKVLLAGLARQVLRELISSVKLSPRGPNTITTKKALWSEIEHVQDEGLAVDDEELVAGLVAVSAPVRDENAVVVAAASLEAPVRAVSVSKFAAAFVPHVVSTADLISARLGYRRTDEVAR
jgi:IclR family pca regulon transcriptional regulator